MAAVSEFEASEEISKKLTGFQFWEKVLGSPRLVVAPMVDQSELAWRLFSREYGAELCYTPMLHASLFRSNPIYRRDNFTTCTEDRPLIVQFCANDPVTLLEAARHVEDQCDGVDINLGCPQTIAKRGHYGAFLQDKWDLIARMVNLLHCELSVPVTCKIRVFEDIEKTVQYAKMLETAGCQILTVHGRTREQKGHCTGKASWEHIKAVKQNVSIPVFANGNIRFLDDVKKCFDETKVDGVMSAEGILYNPSLFIGVQPTCWSVVDGYLKWVKLYPPSVSVVRGHLFKMWHHVLQTSGYDHFRERIGTAKTIEGLESVSTDLKSFLLSKITDEELKSDYTCTIGDIPFWRCQPYIRPSPDTKRSRPEDNETLATNVNKKKKRKKEAEASPTGGGGVKRQWLHCVFCHTHPKGLRCVNNLCKRCCKVKSAQDITDCHGHHLLFKTKFERIKQQEQQKPFLKEEQSTTIN